MLMNKVDIGMTSGFDASSGSTVIAMESKSMIEQFG